MGSIPTGPTVNTLLSAAEVLRLGKSLDKASQAAARLMVTWTRVGDPIALGWLAG